MYVWLVGVAALLLCFRLGRRPLFRAHAFVLNLALAIGVLEAALRIAPGLLGGWLANHAYGGYHCGPGGIYERDAWLGHRLKPAFCRDTYWNGHWWRHETNAAGYRGRAMERADAVFLGDSMIYGHGVEDEQTVPNRFSRRTGCTAANLGQQGTSLVQMLQRFKITGAALRPRVVYVCCHYNDIGEAAYWYSEEELRRYISSSPESLYVPKARAQFQPRPACRIDHHLWDAHLAPALRLSGAITAATHLLSKPNAMTTVSASPHFVLHGDQLDEAFAPWNGSDEDRLGWKVQCRALADLQRLCAAQNARLVLFDIGFPRAFSAAMEAEAARLQIHYSPAGRVALQRTLEGEHVYLSNDGHWSPLGCDIVARELARGATDS